MIEFNKEALDPQSVVITLFGDIDIESSEVIEDDLMPSLQNHMNIILDLTHVDFVDSTGIGLLIKFAQHVSSLESKLTITNIRFDVLEVLKLLQVPEILDFVEFPQITRL